MTIDFWQRMVETNVARRMIHDAMVYNWNGPEQCKIVGYRHVRDIRVPFPKFPKLPKYVKLAHPQVKTMLSWPLWEMGVTVRPVIHKDDVVIWDDDETFMMAYLKYYTCNETMEEYKAARPIPSLEEYRNRVKHI